MAYSRHLHNPRPHKHRQRRCIHHHCFAELGRVPLHLPTLDWLRTLEAHLSPRAAAASTLEHGQMGYPRQHYRLRLFDTGVRFELLSGAIAGRCGEC